MRVECPVVVVTGQMGEPLCVDQQGQAVAWIEQPPFQINFDQVGEPFVAGFLLMATCWALGKGVALVISLVKH